jgi:hypothetical protein
LTMVNNVFIEGLNLCRSIKKGNDIKEVYERPKEAHRSQNEDSRREDVLRIKIERIGISKSNSHVFLCRKSTH